MNSKKLKRFFLIDAQKILRINKNSIGKKSRFIAGLLLLKDIDFLCESAVLGRYSPSQERSSPLVSMTFLYQ